MKIKVAGKCKINQMLKIEIYSGSGISIDVSINVAALSQSFK